MKILITVILLYAGMMFGGTKTLYVTKEDFCNDSSICEKDTCIRIEYSSTKIMLIGKDTTTYLVKMSILEDVNWLVGVKYYSNRFIMILHIDAYDSSIRGVEIYRYPILDIDFKLKKEKK